MSKRELVDYREWFLGVLPERICILEETVRITPGYEHWRTDETPESLGVLGEWLAIQVETRVRTSEELAQVRAQIEPRKLLRVLLKLQKQQRTHKNNCQLIEPNR